LELAPFCVDICCSEKFLNYNSYFGLVQIALLVTLHDVLAEYGLCCAGKECEGGEGAFLKMAIKHLGSLELLVKPTIPHKLPSKSSRTETNETVIKGDDDTILPESPPAPPTDNGDAEENENVSQNMGEHSVGQRQETTDGADMDRRLELGLDYALDQSFFCLYGLNLRGESASNEGLTEHQNTNRGDYKTKEQCAGVLQYILPYAKACSVPSCTLSMTISYKPPDEFFIHVI
jgi:calcineurin-binding protein cabin-1